MKSTLKKPQKICLIGGTFDPIHLGHTYIAAKCHRELQMDKIIFLPCKQSPHKLTKQNAPDQHRIEMCRLATAHLPWAIVDDYDLKAPAPSYSWRTAEVFQERFPDDELYWLMGTDQWEAIKKWSRPEHLASLVTFVVVSRGENPREIEGFNCISLPGAHTASASAIRNTISELELDSALDSPLLQAQLHLNVFEYIRKNSLYRGKETCRV